MKMILLISIFVITLSFALVNLNIGIELIGTINPYIGIDYEYNGYYCGANFGIALDDKSIIFIPTLYVKKYVNDLILIFQSKGILPLNNERFLLLISGGVGLKIKNIESYVNCNYTLPISAVNEFKGPIPSINLNLTHTF